MEAKFEQAGELSLLNEGGLDVDLVLAAPFLVRQNRQQARSDLEQQDQKQEKARRETKRVLSNNLNAQDEGVPSTHVFLRFGPEGLFQERICLFRQNWSQFQ